MANVPPCLLDRPLLRLSHPVLDLGEGLLDRVEVGRIRRQVPEPSSCGVDHLPNCRRFMRTQVVHDDDVARLESRHEKLLHPSAEACAIDRPVEHAGCGEPVVAQRSDEGQRAPVAVRSIAADTPAARAPAPQRRHVGLDPGFINEHQPSRIEARLQPPPALPSAGDVSACLFKGEQRLWNGPPLSPASIMMLSCVRKKGTGQ